VSGPVTDEIVAQAAYNNALWCDAVCSTHHGRGEFHHDLWINRVGVPRYYPDVVTLTGASVASAQAEAISALVRSAPGKGWAVKDSFQSLDLGELGFTPLFDAEWIRATAAAPLARTASRELQWRRVEDEAGLARWEQCWAGETAMPQSRIFMPRLLSDPDIRFVFVIDQDAILGGGIVNRGAGAVGISNVFAANVNEHAIWKGVCDFARSSFPGLPLIAYHHRQETLEAARCAGFATIGLLRVWTLAPSEAERM